MSERANRLILASFSGLFGFRALSPGVFAELLARERANATGVYRVLGI
jgi:hypothetical protein